MLLDCGILCSITHWQFMHVKEMLQNNNIISLIHKERHIGVAIKCAGKFVVISVIWRIMCCIYL